MNCNANVIQECISECMHEVCIALKSCTPLQHAGLVCKEADVLIVPGAGLPIPWPVCAEQIGILLAALQGHNTKLDQSLQRLFAS